MTYKFENLQDVIQGLQDIAFEAGEILLKYQKKRHELIVNNKGAQGIATKADSESEDFIIASLKNRFEKADFLAEESCDDFAGMEKFLKSKEYCWVIDPLDGTNNFVNGIPIYAISIALVKKGEPICGIVYNPLSGESFFAALELGAFFVDFRVNPLKKYLLKVSSSDKEMNECIFSPSPNYEKKNKFESQIDSFKKSIIGARAVRRLGSAAIELCYVAKGNFDGYWEKGLKPWDTAAALIICKEAGAKLTDFNGKTFCIYSESVLAASENLHKKILGKINQV
ncbi:MAG: inositol monophosphatase [Bacteriovoracaceae bacterium]|jgi:myo-inositol-1(or 4)-monophosphatase|nr:inositol monophosphatase [Bacteriovoracaceae bacterium]